MYGSFLGKEAATGAEKTSVFVKISGPYGLLLPSGPHGCPGGALPALPPLQAACPHAEVSSGQYRRFYGAVEWAR